MKISLALIFVGIALIFSARQSESVDDTFTVETCGNIVCPPSIDELEYDECCKYFKDACCTHEENDRLKTIFIVVVVVSVLSFIGLIACVVGIIACCCCALSNASTTTTTTRRVVSTGYAPVPSNIVVANTTTNNTMRPY